MSSGVVLQNNGGDNLTIASGATSFQFPTPLASGSPYDVTVFSKPTGLTCTVNNGSGTHFTGDVNTVSISCVVGPLAGDSNSHTYFLTDNNLLQSTQNQPNASAFSATNSTGLPSGTINALSNNGGGYMYFSTTTSELWQNIDGGRFSLAGYTSGTFTGNITQLMGTDQVPNMLFATSCRAFTQVTPTGLEGVVTQTASDGAADIIFLTSIGNQVWACFVGQVPVCSQITYSGGTLSGSIVALVGPINIRGPRALAFYTSTNQVWINEGTGSKAYQLASFPGDSISQMAIEASNSIYAVTKSNQMWWARSPSFPHNPWTFTPVTMNPPPTGAPSALACSRYDCYFATTTNQLFQSNGSSFSLITPSPNNTGTIIQLSANVQYMYFTTSTNEIWVSYAGGEFTQLATS